MPDKVMKPNFIKVPQIPKTIFLTIGLFETVYKVMM